jgi:WD40 repeat protein
MLETTQLPATNMLIGHQGRCFDLRFPRFVPGEGNSELSDSWLLSASEDGTAKLWNTDMKKCVHTFHHNKSCEVLRAAFLFPAEQHQNLICTSGSDGKSIIWRYENSSSTEKPVPIHTLAHQNEESQVYVTESNEQDPNSLLTAADHQLFVWNIEYSSYNKIFTKEFYLKDKEGVLFGGENRNPNAEAYVFDAKWSLENSNVVNAILSDNTMKLIDIRANETSSFAFPQTIYDESLNEMRKLGHPTSVNEFFHCFIVSV